MTCETQPPPDTKRPVSSQDVAVPCAHRCGLGRCCLKLRGSTYLMGSLFTQISFWKMSPCVFSYCGPFLYSLGNGNYQMKERIKMEKTTKMFLLYWSQTNLRSSDNWLQQTKVTCQQMQLCKNTKHCPQQTTLRTEQIFSFPSICWKSIQNVSNKLNNA